jgi:tripartite ATP-independent transporter DctM subunit
MAGVMVRMRRAQFIPAPRATLSDVGRRLLQAVLPVVTLVILFGGIFGGFSTPTEASAFAVIYGLVVAMIIYRELSLNGLVALFVRTASLVGMVLFMIATAGAFSWVLTIEQVPQRIATAMTNLPGGAPVFVVVSIVALIATGMLFEGLPALLVLAPIFLPVAADLHVNGLTYGLVLIIAMGIGAFAPPLGVGFFVACSVCEATVERTTPRALVYFAVLFVGLLIVAFVPWFTTIVPHLVLHKSF